MKIGAEFDNSKWPALKTRLKADEADAWREAVTILENRIGGRYLAHGTLILNRSYSGFAVLAIDCAVIEALQQFREGKKETPWKKVGTYFRRFLTKTRFKFTDDEADRFFDTVRNGILHQAETKHDTVVNKKQEKVIIKNTPSGKGIVINARRFHEELVLAFGDYKRALLNGDKTLRENFIEKMNHVCRTPEAKIPVVLATP